MLWMLATALATPLLHDADPATAVQRAKVAGVQDELEPLSLEALRGASPWSRNGAPLRACNPGEVDAAAVRGHLLYGELQEAHQRLAEERLRCGGPASARAELERAAGLLALADGDEAKASRAFAVAKGYDPKVPWDDGFPAEQRALFDDAVPLVADLLIVPAPSLVDGGAPSEGPMAAGAHGVLVGRLELHLVHGHVADVLAVPSALGPDLPALSDVAARLELTHALSAAIGPGERVHVAAPDALWTGTTGRTDWTSIPWPAPALAEGPEGPALPEPRRSIAPWLVAGIGGAVVLGGGLLTGVNHAAATGLADDMFAATDRGSYDELRTRAEAANGRVKVGEGLLIGGAGVATIGLVWGVAR